MATEVENIQIVLSAQTTECLEQLKKISSQLETLGTKSKNTKSSTKKLSEVFKALGLNSRKLQGYLSKLAYSLGQCFKESNDYVEAVNLFNVTMGKATETATEYATVVQNVMGIDLKEWMNYQGSFNAIISGFGVAEESANNMSQQLTQLAYDLSSVWNTPVEEAFNKLNSAMTGQIKGIKEYGVNVSVAQLKQTALAHGIELSTSKMTEAQKATLRYITIMEKTQYAQGDLARTIATPANAMRILNAQLTVMKRELGNVVSILAVKVIPYFQALIELVKELAEYLMGVFGYEAPEIDYSSLSATVDYVDDLEEDLNDATDSANKLKKVLMGFDEINKLPDTTTSDSTILGGGLPSDLGLDLSQYDYDFLKGLEVKNLDEIKERLKDVLWYVGAIAGAIVGWKFASAISDVVDLGLRFKDLLGIAMIVGGAIILIKGTIEAIRDGVNPQNFAEMIGGAAVLVGGLAIVFGELGATIGAVLAGVVFLFVGIRDAITNGISFLNGALTVIGGTIIGFVIGGPVGAAIGAAIALIADLVIYVVQNWEQVKTDAKTGLDLIKTWFKTLFGYILQILIGFFNSADDLGTRLKNIFTGIANTFIFLIESKVNAVLFLINSAITAINTIPGVELKHISAVNIPKFASGGYPGDSGQLFVANEAGPELVGQIGGRNAVVNNDQIVASVQGGVYEGVLRALKEQGGSGTNYVVLELDGQAITKNVIKQHNEYVKSTGSSPLMVGG